MKYRIKCLQGSPLSSWDQLYTEQQLVDKFMDYAYMDFEKMPKSSWFTLDNIAEHWQVEFEPIDDDQPICECGGILEKRINLTKEHNEMEFFQCNGCNAQYNWVDDI